MDELHKTINYSYELRYKCVLFITYIYVMCVCLHLYVYIIIIIDVYNKVFALERVRLH